MWWKFLTISRIILYPSGDPWFAEEGWRAGWGDREAEETDQWASDLTGHSQLVRVGQHLNIYWKYPDWQYLNHVTTVLWVCVLMCVCVCVCYNWMQGCNYLSSFSCSIKNYLCYVCWDLEEASYDYFIHHDVAWIWAHLFLCMFSFIWWCIPCARNL